MKKLFDIPEANGNGKLKSITKPPLGLTGRNVNNDNLGG